MRACDRQWMQATWPLIQSLNPELIHLLFAVTFIVSIFPRLCYRYHRFPDALALLTQYSQLIQVFLTVPWKGVLGYPRHPQGTGRSDTGPMGDLWPSKAAGDSPPVIHKNIWNGTRHISMLLFWEVVENAAQCCLLPQMSWSHPTVVRGRWLLLKYCAQGLSCTLLQDYLGYSLGFPALSGKERALVLENNVSHCNDNRWWWSTENFLNLSKALMCAPLLQSISVYQHHSYETKEGFQKNRTSWKLSLCHAEKYEV